MPRGVDKANLPTKTCPVCRRQFTWRKKWQRDWEAVRYCSDRCRADAGRRQPPGDKPGPSCA
ncbi:MAG: DUF2256 domain-containing protein [Hyphomicrobiaceae bacterium]|nr:DUF2256 domain-containing protein [Hyphomicrobiaceae bacterium]